MSDKHPNFGHVISSYSRAQALADGVLVEHAGHALYLVYLAAERAESAAGREWTDADTELRRNHDR